MNSQDVEEDVYERLVAQYGEDSIRRQPRLGKKTSVYPDFAVFREGKSEPFLIVECSSLRTPHRQERDLSQLVEAVKSTGAEFGALVSSDVEFVFSRSSPYFYTVSDFPEVKESKEVSRRPIQSRSELDYLISQSIDAISDGDEGSRLSWELSDILIECLHLLIAARGREIELGSEVDPETVETLRSGIKNRHETYEPTIDDVHLELKAISGIFRGYDLSGTDDYILESLFEFTSGGRGEGEYYTPRSVAQQIVRLSGISSGDIVVDPAAGRGTVLSMAAAEGAHGIGVEINIGTASTATFFVDLLDRDVEIILGNFFREDTYSTELPESIDSLLVDPPFNARFEDFELEKFDTPSIVYSQDAFLAKGLSILDEGGSITLAVPAGFLDNARSSWIREFVLDNCQLESVIHVVGGPLYQNTQIDTAFLTVSKKPPSDDHSVKYVVLESPEDSEEAFEKAVDRIKNGTSSSVPQSALDSSLNFYKRDTQESARSELVNQFGEIIRLSDIADIQSGNHPVEILEQEGEDTIQYLSPGDIHNQGSSKGPRFVPRDVVKTIADDSCVLVSTLGVRNVVHIPSESVAPGNHWAVVKFEDKDTALVYKRFFESDVGQKQIEGLKSGTITRRVNLADLRDLWVPEFTDEEISTQAAKIRKYNDRLRELEEEKNRLKKEYEEAGDDLSDVLGGGDDSE